MATASGSGPEGGDPRAEAPRAIDHIDVPPPRRRPSALRLLAIAAVSVIVSALLFRAVVEATRRALAS